MELISISLIYSICLFGIGEMFVYFDGPFGIIESFRRFAHWIHPKFGELFTCIFCFSTWSGAIMSMINYFLIPVPFTPFNIILGDTGLWYVIMALDMFFGCASTWMWHGIDELVESNTKKEYEDE